MHIITGSIIDPPGHPVQVMFTSDDAHTVCVTDNEGRFRFETEHPGPWQASQPVTFDKGETLTGDKTTVILRTTKPSEQPE